jgi:CheY-like chemotaxis protein/HPt (histidine-containing phosphotransfer) domain-containing protein
VADGTVLRWEVADTGPGIPVERRRLLFQRFERLDADGTRTIEGAGIGLSISEQLAAMVGGHVGYEENPGGGSVFWLDLPLDAIAPSVPAAASAPGVPDAQPAPPVRALHVLVVDDIDMNRDIAAAFLRAAGHTVECVEGGAEAVAAAASTDFDVVLMDVRMPGMDGLEATRRIRRFGGVRGRVPIVALTAQAFTEHVTECRMAGMDSHLGKPFDQEALLAVVAHAFAAGPSGGEGPGAAAVRTAVPGAPPLPVIGAELLVVDPEKFAQTASYLAPDTVTCYLRTIADLGETILGKLRRPDAFRRADKGLLEAAHTLAGSAGLFGFERLAAIGQRFERAARSGTAEAPALADGLGAAVMATLAEIHARTGDTLDL